MDSTVNHLLQAGIVRVYHADWHQTRVPVRTKRVGSSPEITASGIFVADVDAHVHKCLQPVGDGGIDVRTDAEVQVLVLLMLTILDESAIVIHAKVGIILGKPAAAGHLHRSIASVVNLAQIIASEEVHVWITVRIGTLRRVVNLLIAILLRLCRVIVQQSLVVETHIFRCPQELAVSLWHIQARIGTRLDGERLNLTTLGVDENHPLGTLGAIESHCRCAFQHGNLLHLGGIDIRCTSRSTIYQDQRSLSPDISIITTNERLEVVQAIRAIVFLQSFLHVHLTHSPHEVGLCHLTEGYINHAAVSKFLCACHAAGYQHGSQGQ